MSKSLRDIKYEITVTGIDDLVIRASPNINLTISKDDCSVFVWAIGISRNDYERIMMAMKSIDVCAEDYKKRVEEHNKIVSAEWKQQQEDKKKKSAQAEDLK